MSNTLKVTSDTELMFDLLLSEIYHVSSVRRFEIQVQKILFITSSVGVYLWWQAKQARSCALSDVAFILCAMQLTSNS